MTDAELKALAERGLSFEPLNWEEKKAIYTRFLALLAKEAHLIDEQDRVRGLNIEYRDELEMARRSIGELDAENIALRAKEAQRGEVVELCPRCMTAEPLLDGVGGYWYFECGKEFTEPAYFQRVSKPGPAPEEPTTPAD